MIWILPTCKFPVVDGSKVHGGLVQAYAERNISLAPSVFYKKKGETLFQYFMKFGFCTVSCSGQLHFWPGEFSVQSPRGGFCAGCIACLTGFCAEGYFGVLGIPSDSVWIISQHHNHLNQFDFVLVTDESQSCLQEIFLLKDNCRAVNITMIFFLIEILTTERTWYILSDKSHKCFLKV